MNSLSKKTIHGIRTGIVMILNQIRYSTVWDHVKISAFVSSGILFTLGAMMILGSSTFRLYQFGFYLVLLLFGIITMGVVSGVLYLLQFIYWRNNRSYDRWLSTTQFNTSTGPVRGPLQCHPDKNLVQDPWYDQSVLYYELRLEAQTDGWIQQWIPCHVQTQGVWCSIGENGWVQTDSVRWMMIGHNYYEYGPFEGIDCSGYDDVLRQYNQDPDEFSPDDFRLSLFWIAPNETITLHNVRIDDDHIIRPHHSNEPVYGSNLSDFGLSRDLSRTDESRRLNESIVGLVFMAAGIVFLIYCGVLSVRMIV